MSSKEKKKVYEKIKSGFQQDTIAGAKLKKDLPLLATNLNNPKHLEFLFKEYQKEGLIPKQHKNAGELQRYLQRRLNAIWNGIAKDDPSVRNDKGFKNAFFQKRRQEILSEMVQKEAIRKLTPAQKANPEIMEQISKMKWKGLPIKVSSSGELSFNRRYFQDKVSKRVIDYANNIEPGLGDKWAKQMRASWNAIGEKNRAIKANSGLSFDIGHFIPSQLDGPNVGLNAASELSSANRSKGSTPFSGDRNLARQLGIPESWMQSFTDWHLREKGMDPNLLPEGYELKGSQVVDAASGVSDPNAEIAKNQAKIKTDQELLDVVEGYKQQGIIPPEADIKSIDDIKKYSSAKRAIGGDFEIVNDKIVKAARKTPNQQILKVFKGINHVNNLIPKPVKTVLKGGALLGLTGLDVIDQSKAAVKPYVTDYTYDEEKRKLDILKSASGKLGLYSIFTGNAPAFAASTIGWSSATYKEWALGRDKARISDLELSLGITSSDRDRIEPDVLGQGDTQKPSKRGSR